MGLVCSSFDGPQLSIGSLGLLHPKAFKRAHSQTLHQPKPPKSPLNYRQDGVSLFIRRNWTSASAAPCPMARRDPRKPHHHTIPRAPKSQFSSMNQSLMRASLVVSSTLPTRCPSTRSLTRLPTPATPVSGRLYVEAIATKLVTQGRTNWLTIYDAGIPQQLPAPPLQGPRLGISRLYVHV